jgi:CXXC-20-CXXC protein
MKIAKCPYCGRRLSYPSAFMYKSKGEYECTRCKKKSNIYIDKKMWLVFLLTFMVALIEMILIIMFVAEKSPLAFLLIMIPFAIFYFFVPFFVRLRPLKKYKEFVSQQQKYSSRPEMMASLSESEYSNKGPMINTDVFNQIKAKRRIITEEEEARTKAFRESDDLKKVSTDTISGNLLRERTTSFSFKDKEVIFENDEKRNDFFSDD